MMPTMYRRRWMIVLFFTLSFSSLFWWFSNFHKNIENIDMGGEIYVKGDNYNVIEEYSVASSKQQQQRFDGIAARGRCQRGLAPVNDAPKLPRHGGEAQQSIVAAGAMVRKNIEQQIEVVQAMVDAVVTASDHTKKTE